jgi:thioredoxin-related protein
MITIIAISFTSCQQTSTKEKSEQNNPFEEATLAEGEQRVDVYYFHNRMRCPSCIALEEVTYKTLHSFFTEKLEEGKLVFRIISLDNPRSEELVKKYQAFGPTLVISKRNGAQEEIIDLTGEGFRFAMRDEARFIEIVKSAIGDI